MLVIFKLWAWLFVLCKRWLSPWVFLHSPKLYTFGVIFLDQIKVKTDRLALNIPLFEREKHLDSPYGQERKFSPCRFWPPYLLLCIHEVLLRNCAPGLLNRRSKMAASLPSSDDKIAKFLSLADLSSSEVAFQAEGVTKIGHVMDVTKEDLVRIGEGSCICLFSCEREIFIDIKILNINRSSWNTNSQISEALGLHESYSLCSLCIGRLWRDCNVP